MTFTTVPDRRPEQERYAREEQGIYREDTRPARMPAPLPAQLDTDGQAHEIAPHTERMRLFQPAPAQIQGQTYLDPDRLEGEQA